MTNLKTIYEKLASDNLTDDDKKNLLTLLETITKQKLAKANSSKKYLEKLKLNDDAMEKIRMQKMAYYIKKELLKDRERERYNTNNEIRERKKEKNTFELS